MYIEDDIHCDQWGPFATLEDAVLELRRRAGIEWDEEPNRVPCGNLETCGREYRVVEFDDRAVPWTRLRSVRVLSVSAKGAAWVEGFEQEWARPAE